MGTSHQVELPSGKRTKVKTSHVLLRFADPSPAQLIERAHAQADSIELDFLWEVAPQDEFGFMDLAREYFGAVPGPVEATALLLRLHSAPVYFYRKGRGRYRPAPAETLKAALAAVERKRKQEETRQFYVDELKAGRAPDAIAQQAIELIMKPDRSSIELKALEQAAGELRMTPLRLLLARDAIASPYRWHVDSFLAQHFPRGIGFAADLPAPGAVDDLPLASVHAFSIDDSATTEIDDAFSVQKLADRVRVGIHIAAPAAAMPRGHPLDVLARARMSTVYAPGLKYTMLPGPWIDGFSLNEGREVPVLSLYADVNAETFEVGATVSRLERLRIESNLRHDRLDAVVTEASIASGDFDSPFSKQLSFLWHVARVLLARREQVRGRPEPIGRVDYSIELDGADERAHVAIRQRQRGAPLDLIVAELMILANSVWGGWLAARRVAGIYRSQALGRVKMGTVPAPHDGIGVAHYAWSTSPLRRYVDLVNQRQLLACVRDQPAPYAANDAELFSIVSGFDSAYAAYAEFQQKMERYWSFRWLEQERQTRVSATVIKGDVLRIDGLPLITRLGGLADLPRGQRLELDVVATDPVDLTLEARVHRILAAQSEADVDEEEFVDETVGASAAQIAEPGSEAVESASAADGGAASDALDPFDPSDPLDPPHDKAGSAAPLSG
ncbi:MAG: RNB domain-containing ribonuclease [Burkholderiaceae bacterium]|nr:RNB domain-containing ribonuclease [Burkholderiaceae bacterium]